MQQYELFDDCKAVEDVYKEYTAAYQYLYDHEDELPRGAYRALVTMGEIYTREYPDDYRALCKYRQDVFTSDRELAALAMAVSV